MYLVEFDEEKLALKRNTITLIDAYEPGFDKSRYIQLSNFSLLENRQTKQIELYLTRYGERKEVGQPDYLEADVFQYRITLK